MSATTIRYVALGDSYTIGEGASEEASWPSVLTKHLQRNGIDIQLVANPSVTGWTTQQVIDRELSVYDEANPTFATLLIGVNDWVQGVDNKTFRHNLVIILDRMQSKLPDKSKLVLVTIPDFLVTPSGRQFSSGRDSSKGIAEFNAIIIEEAIKKNLSVVDIYPLTQQMQGDLVSSDGLHPSAKEYALWENLIYPVVIPLLRK
ncbi:SGNH/GDSL hydrolase family protein [soil metagenome]